MTVVDGKLSEPFETLLAEIFVGDPTDGDQTPLAETTAGPDLTTLLDAEMQNRRRAGTNKRSRSHDREGLRESHLVLLFEALSNFDPTPLLDRSPALTPEKSHEPAGQTDLRQPNRKLKPSEITELVTAYQAGAGLAALARQWGMHEKTVRRVLERAGVSPRPLRAMTDTQVGVAVAHYVTDGWSILRLARHFGHAEGTIRSELVKTGVTLRSRGQPRTT